MVVSLVHQKVGPMAATKADLTVESTAVRMAEPMAAQTEPMTVAWRVDRKVVLTVVSTARQSAVRMAVQMVAQTVV